ncbi:MAG: thioredoxin family protein [Myxococcales bacterium]|nr:thioredoxin family protein [Myxococcales bacterium]
MAQGLPSPQRTRPPGAHFLRTLALALVIASWIPQAAHADAFGTYLAQGWHWAYLMAFVFGVLTSLTPCVYPMIPIIVGIFGARGANVSRRRAMFVATCYVLGICATYSVLGIVVALISISQGSLLASPWVVIPIALLYVALALSLFGAFELNLPAGLQAKLNNVGGAGPLGAFLMGLVGGLTAAPCTGPFLAGILGFVSTTKNVFAGGSLLFVYALGMGVLFWFIAVFSIALPKSGRWMEYVKSLGGIMLLVAAIYFARTLVPLDQWINADMSWLIAAAIMIALGLLLGAVHKSFAEAPLIRLRKAAGILLVTLGATIAMQWTLTPKQKLPWQYDEAAAFAAARAQGKGVMVDFSATWCLPCTELELAFAAPEVYAAITDNFITLKFDVTNDTEADQERQTRYGAKELPAVVFVSTNGVELARISAAMSPANILPIVQRAAHIAPPTAGAAKSP